MSEEQHQTLHPLPPHVNPWRVKEIIMVKTGAEGEKEGWRIWAEAVLSEGEEIQRWDRPHGNGGGKKNIYCLFGSRLSRYPVLIALCLRL